MLTEQRTEHHISRLVQMSEKADRKDEEMTDMRKAFDTNRSETISLSRKFKEQFEVQEAEHKNIFNLLERR